MARTAASELVSSITATVHTYVCTHAHAVDLLDETVNLLVLSTRLPCKSSLLRAVLGTKPPKFMRHVQIHRGHPRRISRSRQQHHSTHSTPPRSRLLNTPPLLYENETHRRGFSCSVGAAAACLVRELHCSVTGRRRTQRRQAKDRRSG